jgi:simple sugar transport system substrate-binding protein
MTFGALEAIHEKGLTTVDGGDITLLSFDGDEEALELVESGAISCEVECNPRQGELVAEVIKKLEAGETVEKNYYVEEQIFTRE